MEQLALFPLEVPERHQLLPLAEYSHVLVQFSGGKDSLAALLYLLELGVPRDKIMLWHQRVDGGGTPEEPAFIDWPVTDAYVTAVAEALGITLEFQWRYGGFRTELLRDNAPTADVYYQHEDTLVHLPTVNRRPGTRLRFPALSADLSRRYCSAYLKVDPGRRVIANHPALQPSLDEPQKKVLIITGERREESSARSRYAEVEIHAANSRRRRVDAWRTVIDWPEAKVWEIIERWAIRPHPAYLLSFPRTSCLGCVFSTPDLWAAMREIAPDRFSALEEMEARLNFTIDPKLSLGAKADKGTPRLPIHDPNYQTYLDWALGRKPFTAADAIVKIAKWELPAGAFHGSAGGPI